MSVPGRGGLRAGKRRPSLPAMKITAALVATLLLTGCGLFSAGLPQKVSGDADGVVVRGGSDTDRRSFAASHCGSFNKSAVLLPREQGDSSGLLRASCH